MAKNGFFVIAFRILAYLYECLREGERPEKETISHEALNIPLGYWISILRMLSDEGYIKGVRISKTLRKEYSADIRNIEITMKGIEYFEDNKKMSKVRDFLLEMKDIVPGLLFK